MAQQTQNPQAEIYFDPNQYITDLMGEIGFDEMPEAERAKMHDRIEKQMTQIILDTIAMEADAYAYDEALAESTEETAIQDFVGKIIEYSPDAQVRIFQALDGFYSEMVEAYKQFFAK
jgi:hypothetical protein